MTLLKKKKHINTKMVTDVMGLLAKPDFIESVYNNLSMMFMRYLTVWINERLLRSKQEVNNNNSGMQVILNFDKKSGMIAEFFNHISPLLLQSLKLVFKNQNAIILYLNDLYDIYVRHLGENQKEIIHKLSKTRMMAVDNKNNISTEHLEKLSDNSVILDTLIRIVERDIVGYSGTHLYTYQINDYPFTNI